MKKTFLFAFLASLWLTGLFIYPDDDLAKIKQTLADRSYGNYWDRLRAISKLKSFNSKEAAITLVSLFDDDEAPIRESALVALGGFTDNDAVDYLSGAALVNPKSRPQRFYAAWALGRIKRETVLPHLLKALNDEIAEEVTVRIIKSISELPNRAQAEDILIKKSSDNSLAVRAAAINSLGNMRSEKAYTPILKRAYSSDVTMRIAALEALAQIKPGDAAGHLESALKDLAPEARIAALETMTKYATDKAFILKSAADLLRDKNPAVRAAAVQSLRALREKEGLRILVERLPDAPWRLRYDIITALKDLSGRDLGFDAKAWVGWYQADKERIEIAPKDGKSRPDSGAGRQSNPARETVPTFFGIPILGRNVVFVVDFSRSMKNEAEDDDDKKEQKADVAIQELEETLSRFSPEINFNIIILSTEASRYNKRKASKTMLAASDENKKRALDFVRSLWDRLGDFKRGRGDHYDALIEALSEPEADTVFLLSDGRPTYGTYIDKENILENIAGFNRFKKVVINTIITGIKETRKDRELMERLAEDSNGICASR